MGDHRHSDERQSNAKPATPARGSGGETHQRASHPDGTITTSQGTPISDDQNSLRAGARGPTLLEDFVLRDKLFHFDHERIPERVVHARGFGAHGYFETLQSLTDITSADLFARQGERTPAFVRFSTVAGSKGSADLARDVRGFAVKLYTREGNWDIVGNNIPVFFIQDAMKFPDLVHAVKEEPDRGFPQAQSAHDNFWDFISLMPESMHMIMWVMSDRAIPRSFRTMEGFGVHTFRMVNAAGESSFVKFHWKPKLGLQSVVWDEALKINGADPDYHRRDLWNAIQAGDFPEWELGLQVFTQEQADAMPFDILDATKLVPEELVPVRIVGRLVLDRCVENFFAETEQVAFCTQNIVPGIDFSDDPLLHGRNFSYLDTQLKRLGGPNFQHLPINAPKCPWHHFQQDGHMAMANPAGRANYEPNSWGKAGGPREHDRGFRSFPAPVRGSKERVRAESFADHYSQARQFYVSQTEVEQRHIADALTFELSKVEVLRIRERVVSHLVHIDPRLAAKVAESLGLEEVPEPAEAARPVRTDLPQSPALSILRSQKQTLLGRSVGCLVADGVSGEAVAALRKALRGAGAELKVVAPKIGGVSTDDGETLAADEKLGGGPSVLFDAIVIAVSERGASMLAEDARVRDFLTDAYVHCKYIGYTPEAAALLERCGLSLDGDHGLVQLAGAKGIGRFVEDAKNLRYWSREPRVLTV